MRARAVVRVAAVVGAWIGGPLGVGAQAEDPLDGARVPVLLVPGWFDTERDLAALRIRFESSGWRPEEVEALSFQDPTGDNRRHAEEIDSAARALLERTGADELDVVAFSMGGLATRWYLLHGGPVPVRRAVFIATPHRGTWSAYLAWGHGSEDMEPESSFLDSLNAGAPLPPGIAAITVRTPFDTRVVPGESATLEGFPDHTVCCPTHNGLLRDLEVFEIVRSFLLEGSDPARRPEAPHEEAQ